MEIKKPRSRMRLPTRVVVIRFVVLMIAFLAVLSLIRSLQSNQFQNFLTQLFSTGKTWNWCPPSTNKLEVVATGQLLETPGEVQGFCSVQIEPFETETDSQPQFKPVLKARNAEGAEALLEEDHQRGLFRVQGLPFRSEKLVHAFRRIGQP